MAKVVATITPQGAITLEAEGFQGAACEEAVKVFAETLEVQGEEHKPEYWLTQDQGLTQEC